VRPPNLRPNICLCCTNEFYHLFLKKTLLFQNFVVSLQRTTNHKESMTIVSTRDFRANQTKFLDMALRGEHVVLKSRRGSVRLMPIEEEEEPKRD
jgi:hypothetical protein